MVHHRVLLTESPRTNTCVQSAGTYVGMGGVGRLEAGLTLAMMARSIGSRVCDSIRGMWLYKFTCCRKSSQLWCTCCLS